MCVCSSVLFSQSYAGLDEPTTLNTEGIVGSLTEGGMVREGEEGGVESDGRKLWKISRFQSDFNYCGVVRMMSC